MFCSNYNKSVQAVWYDCCTVHQTFGYRWFSQNHYEGLGLRLGLGLGFRNHKEVPSLPFRFLQWDLHESTWKDLDAHLLLNPPSFVWKCTINLQSNKWSRYACLVVIHPMSCHHMSGVLVCVCVEPLTLVPYKRCREGKLEGWPRGRCRGEC